VAIKIKKHSVFETQCYVIKALFKRELVTRFGKYKLGVLWMLVDPLMSVIVLGLLLGPILGRTSGDIPYAFFLLCGFMMLKSLTGPINMGIGAVSSNQGLLVFRQVQPLDPFLTRFIFEFFTNGMAFTIFCLLGAWFGIPMASDRLWELLACFAITWFTGCGLGLLLGVNAMKVKEIEKIQQYIQRPLIFISCVLYPLSAIPEAHHPALLYNPLVHTIEYSRDCLFHNYVVPEVSLVYPGVFALVCMSLGMMSYRNNRHFLTQR